MRLMIDSYNHPAPETIIKTYTTQGTNDDTRAAALWDAHKEPTLDNMANCCVYLASLWESAWLVGGGEEVSTPGAIREYNYEADLRPQFKPMKFFRSVALADMEPLCGDPPKPGEVLPPESDAG